jgi:hypothetical protein
VLDIFVLLFLIYLEIFSPYQNSIEHPY